MSDSEAHLGNKTKEMSTLRNIAETTTSFKAVNFLIPSQKHQAENPSPMPIKSIEMSDPKICLSDEINDKTTTRKLSESDPAFTEVTPDLTPTKSRQTERPGASSSKPKAMAGPNYSLGDEIYFAQIAREVEETAFKITGVESRDGGFYYSVVPTTSRWVAEARIDHALFQAGEWVTVVREDGELGPDGHIVSVRMSPEHSVMYEVGLVGRLVDISQKSLVKKALPSDEARHGAENSCKRDRSPNEAENKPKNSSKKLRASFETKHVVE